MSHGHKIFSTEQKEFIERCNGCCERSIFLNKIFAYTTRTEKARGHEVEYEITGCWRTERVMLPEFEPEQCDRILSERIGRTGHAEQPDIERFELTLIERAIWEAIRDSTYQVRVIAKLDGRTEIVATSSDCTVEQLRAHIRERYWDVKTKIPGHPWEEEITIECQRIPEPKPFKEWQVTAWYQDKWMATTAPRTETAAETAKRVQGLIAMPKNIQGKVEDRLGKAKRRIEYGDPGEEMTISKGGAVRTFRPSKGAGDDDFTAAARSQTGIYYNPSREAKTQGEREMEKTTQK
jgi:hypothetical protein